MANNPLQKYFRQPKIYLTLPSKGRYYPDGTLDGDPESLPVFGMTAMDEIMMKTPDALFSGESIVSVIRSCIPAIKDPWSMPQIDLDAVLIGIRMATYGQKLGMTYTCSKCREDNQFDVDLSRTLDYFLTLSFDDHVFIDPLTVHLRPLTYKEQNETSLKQYELRRMLFQIDESLPEEQKSKMINDILLKLTELQVLTFKKCIAAVEADDTVVENVEQIQEFIQNSDKIFFDKVKEHLEGLTDVWKIQDQEAECHNCGHKNPVSITLNNSDFFARR